jgi:hypothetical protein
VDGSRDRCPRRGVARGQKWYLSLLSIDIIYDKEVKKYRVKMELVERAVHVKATGGAAHTGGFAVVQWLTENGIQRQEFAMVEFLKTGPTLTDQRLAEAQGQLGCTFPDEYVAFLRKKNGGSSHEYGMDFTSRWTGTKQTVALFLWLGIGALKSKDGVYGVEEAARNLSGSLPARMVPIALDSSGNAVLLSTSGKDRGAVFVYEQEAPQTRSLSQLATSFPSFLDRLALRRKRS